DRPPACVAPPHAPGSSTQTTSHKQEEDNRSRPHSKKAESGKPKAEILRVTDIAVNSGVDHSSAKQPRAINLGSQNKESQQAQSEGIAPQVPAKKFQRSAGGENRMREQEARQPGCGWGVIQPL